MFTSTPQSFGSLYDSQNFKFTGTFVEDQTYEIKEVQSDCTIGIKKFYQTSTADLNISPLVRPFVVPAPLHHATGFMTNLACGAAQIVVVKSGSVDTESVESDPVIVNLSKSAESEVAVLTTLPLERSISLGEGEIIAVRCEPSAAVRAIVHQFGYDTDNSQVSDTATSITQYEVTDDGRGMVLFSSVAERIGSMLSSEEEFASYKVEILAVEELDMGGTPIYITSEIATLNYQIIDPPAHPMRLAWVSSRGNIEHYTMPYLASESVQRSGERIYTLQSALETYDVREALAEVVSSEGVWLDNGDGYLDVTIEDSEIELSPEEDLAVVKFKISYGD